MWLVGTWSRAICRSSSGSVAVERCVHTGGTLHAAQPLPQNSQKHYLNGLCTVSLFSMTASPALVLDNYLASHKRCSDARHTHRLCLVSATQRCWKNQFLLPNARQAPANRITAVSNIAQWFQLRRAIHFATNVFCLPRLPLAASVPVLVVHTRRPRRACVEGVLGLSSATSLQHCQFSLALHRMLMITAVIEGSSLTAFAPVVVSVQRSFVFAAYGGSIRCRPRSLPCVVIRKRQCSLRVRCSGCRCDGAVTSIVATGSNASPSATDHSACSEQQPCTQCDPSVCPDALCDWYGAIALPFLRIHNAAQRRAVAASRPQRTRRMHSIDQLTSILLPSASCLSTKPFASQVRV